MSTANWTKHETVIVDDGAIIGASCSLCQNVYIPRSAVARKDEYRPTLIKRGPRW